jgi:hypothetical protein
MAAIPELLDGHVTLEIECLDRLYINGYIGKLATGPGLVMFMRGQWGKPVPPPVVLGQVSEKFREAVKTQAVREQVPIYQFRHKERKDDIANHFRRERQVRDGIVFIGVAQEKAQAFNGKKVNSSSSIATKRSRSITTTSTSMTRTSGRCLSHCAATRPGVFRIRRRVRRMRVVAVAAGGVAFAKARRELERLDDEA